MEAVEKKEKRTHHGHTVKRLRQTLGIKQESLAADLNITQQAVSLYEQKQVIEDEMLQKIASILQVPVDLIKDAEEDPLTIIIENNTFTDSDNISVGKVCNENENFSNIYHPIDKIIELSNEKTALYERMLALEKEKVALLEELLREKK